MAFLHFIIVVPQWNILVPTILVSIQRLYSPLSGLFHPVATVLSVIIAIFGTQIPAMNFVERGTRKFLYTSLESGNRLSHSNLIFLFSKTNLFAEMLLTILTFGVLKKLMWCTLALNCWLKKRDNQSLLKFLFLHILCKRRECL